MTRIKGFCFLIFLFFVVPVGCKENKANADNVKYPKDFPQACIAYFNKWNIYLNKMEGSKRFDAETVAAFKSHRDSVLAMLAEKRSLFATDEQKKSYCLLDERSDTFFKPIDNMHNMTQAELEKAMLLEYIKKLHRERRK